MPLTAETQSKRKRMKRFDLYGGVSGLVLLAQNLTEDEIRKRLDEYLQKADAGFEFRIERVG